MTNKGRRARASGLLPLSEIDPSEQTDIETVVSRPKEPTEKTGRETPLSMHSMKQKTVELSNTQERNAPYDAPNVDEIKESTILLYKIIASLFNSSLLQDLIAAKLMLYG